MELLITQIRREFQIPPYFPDDALAEYVKEGKERLEKLNPGSDLEKDHTFRMLLKNYVYYAYHHKVNEWEQNYASLITNWQLGTETET